MKNTDFVCIIYIITSNAKEGDILKLSNGSYVVDYEETRAVSDKIREKMDKFKSN